MKKIVIIGATWPEPNTTGAGVRMLQLIQFFKLHKYNITFACCAQPNEATKALEALGVTCKLIVMNDPSFDTFLLTEAPQVVLFDRFITEEQFGWRVAKHLPKALRILDLEDLHCLRKVRQEIAKTGTSFDIKVLLESDIAKREIASIYRCDITLVISTFEYNLLLTHFNISTSILLQLPFMFKPVSKSNFEALALFDERSDFITIGNFLHQPNWDSVLYLKQQLWPLIRKELPKAQLKVYGAYGAEKAQQLHNPSEGFLICGPAPKVDVVFKSARVLLAPLRFGAGLKTKIVDGMRFGVPNVTTLIGAEGLNDANSWNGSITSTAKDFVKAAVGLYAEPKQWKTAVLNGFEMFNNLFDEGPLRLRLHDKIEKVTTALEQHRAENFIGQMMLHHSMQSTKYLSKWIEEKQKLQTIKKQHKGE